MSTFHVTMHGCIATTSTSWTKTLVRPASAAPRRITINYRYNFSCNHVLLYWYDGLTINYICNLSCNHAMLHWYICLTNQDLGQDRLTINYRCNLSCSHAFLHWYDICLIKQNIGQGRFSSPQYATTARNAINPSYGNISSGGVADLVNGAWYKCLKESSMICLLTVSGNKLY